MVQSYAVVIPVYNEAELLNVALERLMDQPAVTHPSTGKPLDRIVVLINDGSTDGSSALVDDAAQRYDNVHAIHHTVNQGKGAAIRSGFAHVLTSGADIAIIHDADLEYDPADHDGVLKPLLDGRADAVIGSRFLGGTHRVLYYYHFLANRFITLLSNALTNLNLTDIECCFKAFNRAALDQLDIKEPRFGVEPEIVAKLAKGRITEENAAPRRLRIYEVPISYSGRTYEEGKKITWRDGVSALRCIIRYNLLTRRR